MDVNWRSALAQDSRQKIVNKIMETLQRHMPPSGQDGMHELRKIALRFEEKIYQAATDQHDYLRKISLKMLQLENRTQPVPNNPLSSNSNAPSSLDTGSLVQQAARNQAHSSGNGLQQSLSRQQALPVQSGISGAGMQSSSALGSSLSSLSGLPQVSLSNVGAQGSGLSSITGINQNSLSNPTGQSLPQNLLLANQRLPLHSRQQQQQQQQMTSQQPPSQQQVVQQQHQSNAQQQPQQQALQQQQQHQQQQVIYQQRLQQQQTALLKQKLQQSMQQPVLQQSAQTMVQQQQHQIPILQAQQQSQSLLNQQNNLQSLQQQQLLQHQYLQQAKVQQQQQSQQPNSSLATFLPQPQQQQTHVGPQAPQASVLSQPQQQPSLLTQPQSQQLQQQSTLIHEQPQRLQQPSSHLQQSNLLDHQKLLQAQQRGVSEASSTSMDSSGQTGQSGIVDPQDIVWAKMQVLKEKYFQDMKDLLEMLKSRSQQPMPPEQFQKLTHYMNVLHRMIPYLVASKGSLPPEFKQDKVDTFEKQIANIMDTFKRRKQTPQQAVNPQQQMQAVDSVQSLQQQQQQQSQQSPQMLQQEKSMLQAQQLNTQTGGASFSNNMPALQKSTCSILQPSANSLQQNIVNSMQSGASNVLQTSVLNSLQQNNIGSLQQHAIANIQSSVPMLQLQQSQQMLQQDQQQLLQAQQQRLLKDQEQLKQLQQQRQVDLKAKQAAALQQVILQQNKQHMNQRTLLQQQMQQQQSSKIGQSQVVSSPPIFQAASPQILQQMSPQIDQASVVTPGSQITRAGTHFQSTPPFMTPSPSMLSVASPMLEDMGEARVPTPAVSSMTTASCVQSTNSAVTQSGTSMLCGSPFLGDFSLSPQSIAVQDGKQCLPSGALLGEKYASSEPPLERLVKLINSMSSKALSSAVNDVRSVIDLSDKLAGSAPGSQSRAVVGEDLALMTKCRLQAKAFLSQEGSGASKRKRHLDSVALSMVSSDGSVFNSLQKLNGPDSSESLSTATSKRPRFDISVALEEEIKQINNELIDTSVEISDDAVDEAGLEGRGVVLTCSYNAVAVDPNISNHSNLVRMVSISPMRLLIPSNYPDCSPVVLIDKLAPDYNHPVSRLARDEFGRVARCLSQPVSLRAIARAWDECARNAVAEVAALNGGGCFSSSYGTWESCVRA